MSAPAPAAESSTCSIELRPAICCDRAVFNAEASATERIIVELGDPGPEHRGRLAAFVEGRIEDSLKLRGAAPSGLGADAGINASLCDQLYRARLLGAGGLALAFGSLGGIADRSGVLDPDDSATLRWWLRATDGHPVQLLLPPSAADLRVYDAPTRLSHWLPAGAESGARAAIIEYEIDEPVDPALESSAECMKLASLLETPTDADPGEPVEADAPVLADGDHGPRAMGDAEPSSVGPRDADSEPHADDAVDPADPMSAPSRQLELALAAAFDETDDGRMAQVEHEGTDSAPSSNDADGATPSVEDHVEATPGFEQLLVARDLTPPPSRKSTSAPPPPPMPRAQRARDDARVTELSRQAVVWMRELSSAQGPKPLGVIERLFVSAYVPLCHAVAEGAGGDEARDVMLEWSHSFETSYRPAFDSLRQRGKRPTMVLDVPDIAKRLGRLHGARQVQLLLVDGMRFDIGQAMRQSLKTLTAGTAACAEQLLLWAGLPSTTGAQLEMLGRGPGGLHDFTGAVDEAGLVSHGEEARKVRRLRTGPHEVYKLDLIEDSIASSGPQLARRIADLAEETAQIVSDHLRTLPPRTLVLVFGDHGFLMEQRGNRTKAASQGGATPDEVFVPAYAWITENVH